MKSNDHYCISVLRMLCSHGWDRMHHFICNFKAPPVLAKFLVDLHHLIQIAALKLLCSHCSHTYSKTTNFGNQVLPPISLKGMFAKSCS
jgi:hypothetical protein